MAIYSIGSVLFAIKVPLLARAVLFVVSLFLSHTYTHTHTRFAVNRSRTVHITVEILPEGQENVLEKCVAAA